MENPDTDNESPISEAVMDRIIHNDFVVMVDGKVSMRLAIFKDCGIEIVLRDNKCFFRYDAGKIAIIYVS